MMSDVKCPYCEEEQEINHDDGYGYEDGGEYEQVCTGCDKEFKFFTSISFDYRVHCSESHDMDQSDTEGCEALYQCSKCDHYEVRR